MIVYVQGVSVMLYEPSEALVTGNSWPDVPTAFRLTPARGAPPAASVTVPEIHPGAGTVEMPPGFTAIVAPAMGAPVAAFVTVPAIHPGTGPSGKSAVVVAFDVTVAPWVWAT